LSAPAKASWQWSSTLTGQPFFGARQAGDSGLDSHLANPIPRTQPQIPSWVLAEFAQPPFELVGWFVIWRFDGGQVTIRMG